MNLTRLLSEGGGYTLPYLLKIYNDTLELFVINDNKELTYNGKIYKASTFDYEPAEDGSASLEIEIVESNIIINMLESESIKVDVVGVLNGDGGVTPTQMFKHRYGSANWDGKTLKLKLNADDRLNMTFPALIFNSYNSRG